MLIATNESKHCDALHTFFLQNVTQKLETLWSIRLSALDTPSLQSYYRQNIYCTVSWFVCVHARIPNGGKARVSDKSADSRRGSSCVSGSWQAERGSRRHADIFATILARKSARMSVSVSVSVPWNSSFTVVRIVQNG